MQCYAQEEVQFELKDDDSPLTVADKQANKIITDILSTTEIPIISEENEEIPFSVRREWTDCWVVDPLDGTKEFLNRNGEFTVNIALVSQGKPQLGIIFAPALDILYFAIVNEQKAYKCSGVSKKANLDRIIADAIQISPTKIENTFKVVGSRSHMNKETEVLFEKLKKEHSAVEIIPTGSSLKFCMVAEGAAHCYPRFGPTMEWDTAAGQAICEAVGLSCRFTDTGDAMRYNRRNLRNAHFIVQ